MAHEIITITDPASGTSARFLPSLGCNCFDFRVHTAAGPLEVLWSEPGFELGDKRASGSGVPLLFPFPGRIKGTTLRWENREFPLEPGDGLGNAIHGFVHERRWRVQELTGNRLVAEFHASLDDPALLGRWPADFRVTASYEVRATRLSATYRMENVDEHALPCGFGTHPYFRVPLGGSAAASCRVRLPARSVWKLSEMIPTGRQHPVEDAARAAKGQQFGEMYYDDVFGDLISSAGRCEATIDDPESKRRMTLGFDSAFRACVIYTPPHRQAICIEPYTCVPDAYQLEQRKISTGLRVLAPGESFTVHMAIALS